MENINHDNDCLNVSSLLAPNTAHLNDINLSEHNDSLPYQSLEPTCRKQSQYDLGQDMGVAINSQESDISLPYCIPDDQYFLLCKI